MLVATTASSPSIAAPTCEGVNPITCRESGASGGLSLSVFGSASIQYSLSAPPGYIVSASADATAPPSGFSVVLSGPSGQSTLASLNLTFDGRAGIQGQAFTGSASVSIGTSLIGPGGTAMDSGALFSDQSSSGTFGTGLLSDWLQDGGGVLPVTVTTSSLLVDAGDTVTVGLSLSGHADCSSLPFSPYSSCGAFFDVPAFSFATTGPVFNLPAGWTANSVDGSIVNNMFIIPEPSAALLLLGGLIGLAGWRRLNA